MPIQVIAPTNRGFGEDLAMLQLLTGAAQSGIQGWKQYNQEQALVDVLAGMPGQGPKPLNPGAAGEQNALAAALSGGPAVQGPPTAGTPGLMPGISRDEARSYAQSGLGPTLAQYGLEQRFPKPGEGFTVGPNEIRYNAAGQEIARGPASAPGPLSSAGKIATDLGVDIRTPEGMAAVQAVLKSGGTNINIDTKVPSQAVTAQAAAPGSLTNISNIAGQLITPDGQINTMLLTQMNVPGFNAAIPNTAGSVLRSQFDEAVGTLMYLRTGKAATNEERAAFGSQYMPSPLDTAAGAVDKISRLDRAIRDELEVSSRGLPGASQAPPAAPIPPASAEPGFVDQLLGQGMSYFGGGAPAAGPAAPAQAPAPAAPSISSMSLEQLNALDRSAMSDADLRAAAERYKSLGGM